MKQDEKEEPMPGAKNPGTSTPATASANVPALSGSSALPSAQGAQWPAYNPALAQLSATFTSVHVEKTDPAILSLQIEATKDIAEKIHAESMKGYELQEKNTDYLFRLAVKREAKDNGILAFLGLVVLVILITGIVFLFQGNTTEGIGIVSGVLGLLLGFLGGYGVARKGN